MMGSKRRNTMKYRGIRLGKKKKKKLEKLKKHNAEEMMPARLLTNQAFLLKRTVS